MELERGVFGMERKDAEQGRLLRRWFSALCEKLFLNRILPIDDNTAKICGALHIPDRMPENDAWIAATAVQHDLILVTRNIGDFIRSDIKLFNPFEGKYQL